MDIRFNLLITFKLSHLLLRTPGQSVEPVKKQPLDTWVMRFKRNARLISGIVVFSISSIATSQNQVNIQPQNHEQSEAQSLNDSGQKDTLVFFQRSNAEQDKFLKALETQLTTKMPNRRFQFIDLTRSTKRELEGYFKSAGQCAMAVGPFATQKMLTVRKPINYFSVFTSRNLLDQLNRVYRRLGISVSGIYEEQPFERQIYLSKALNASLNSIGLLLDQKDKYYLPEFQSIALENKLALNYRILGAADSPEKYLSDVASVDTYLLLTNNNQLFMKSKLASLVLSAYYQQVKLIGNRYEDAKVGTLASVYTPPTTLAIEAVSEFKSVCESGQIEPPRYAKSFSVIINKQIAENLNMVDLNANQLSKHIAQMENKR